MIFGIRSLSNSIIGGLIRICFSNSFLSEQLVRITKIMIIIVSMIAIFIFLDENSGL